MRNPKAVDYIFLIALALIWSSAFFNIKIATNSYGPVTITFLRTCFGTIPVIALCLYKKIKIEAFSKDWYWFAVIGLVNLVIPFFLISYGIKKVQSNLAAILMASNPLIAIVLAHIFTKNEKFNFTRALGVLIGFLGILYLFSDDILINKNNIISVIAILIGSSFYVLGALLTLKISNKRSENIAASTLIWSVLFLTPMAAFIEKPWNLTPSIDSTFSVIYLGVVSTGLALLLRIIILKNNGLIFLQQSNYLTPIFGIILGYLFLNESITPKILIAVIAIIFGLYLVSKTNRALHP